VVLFTDDFSLQVEVQFDACLEASPRSQPEVWLQILDGTDIYFRLVGYLIVANKIIGSQRHTHPTAKPKKPP